MTADKHKTLVTAALPYANGPLHIGHMVEYVQADIFARFLRLTGSPVAFVCADDTHGAPIEIAASKAGIKPEELIASYYTQHLRDFNDFLVSFDIFSTTHSPENQAYSDFFFTTLKKKGFIYERLVEQTYCERCKRFLPDRYVKGTCPKCGAKDQYGDHCEKCSVVYKPVDLLEPRCVVCSFPPVRRSSVHYFFKLSAFSEQLRTWLTGNSMLQQEIKNFVLSWINAGLEDWDITRDGPYFGFKIPGELSKYYYVWLDAPIGYIASTEKYVKSLNASRSAAEFWQQPSKQLGLGLGLGLEEQPVRIIHFIGKDIIYFHLLFWPALLMGVGYSLPSDVVVHGHLTINGEKMSKSRGNFFTVREYLEKYDPELLRFYYAGNLTKTSTDINLDFKDFRERINSELVANISNFVYRTLNFINNNFDSQLSSQPSKEPALTAQLKEKTQEVVANYRQLNYREAVKGILEMSSLGNKYLQDTEPWKLIKKDQKKCQEILTFAAAIVRDLTILLTPIIPGYALKVQKQLGCGENLPLSKAGEKLGIKRINKARIIFTPLEEVPQLGESLFPADLRVGVIESVEDHPAADKLYVVRVNLGTQSRTLVAGLKAFYTKEHLMGRNVILVANLKPAKLRGVESQGMLLAAEGDGKVVLLAAPKSAPGDAVFADGLKSASAQISIDELYALGLAVEGKRVFYGEKILKTEKSEIVADAPDGAKIR